MAHAENLNFNVVVIGLTMALAARAKLRRPTDGVPCGTWEKQWFGPASPLSLLSCPFQVKGNSIG